MGNCHIVTHILEVSEHWNHILCLVEIFGDLDKNFLDYRCMLIIDDFVKLTKYTIHVISAGTFSSGCSTINSDAGIRTTSTIIICLTGTLIQEGVLPDSVVDQHFSGLVNIGNSLEVVQELWETLEVGIGCVVQCIKSLNNIQGFKNFACEIILSFNCQLTNNSVGDNSISSIKPYIKFSLDINVKY
jgi:hypothetical protein